MCKDNIYADLLVCKLDKEKIKKIDLSNISLGIEMPYRSYSSGRWSGSITSSCSYRLRSSILAIAANSSPVSTTALRSFAERPDCKKGFCVSWIDVLQQSLH